MPIIQALPLIASILQAIKDLSETATAASSGAKLNAILSAIGQVSAQAVAVLDIVRRAAEQGRETLTDEEKAAIVRLDDEARTAQIAALQTPDIP